MERTIREGKMNNNMREKNALRIKKIENIYMK